MAGMVPEEEAKQQVRAMGKMLAALYSHFAREIVVELGEEKGEELILKAVRAYPLAGRAALLRAGVQGKEKLRGGASQWMLQV